MFKGKKILVLGGAFPHCKVVEAAHELGLKVYVTDYLKNSPAKKIADVSLMYDVKDIETIVEYCKKENIKGVINTSLDPCQIPYQKICEELSLPCFGNKKQFFQLTNKNIFKELCKQYGINTIVSYNIDDFEQVNHFEIEFPVIIKPENGSGSKGQFVCHNLKQARETIAHITETTSAHKIVIEKYINNAQDFAAAYMIIDGKAHLIRTCDRYTGSINEGLSQVAVAAINPSKYTKMYLDHVNEKVCSMLQGIGIQNGPVFMQGLVDKETIRFYDPGFRFSGGEYERLFKMATGIDLIKMLVFFSITGVMSVTPIQPDVVFLNGKRILHLDPTLSPGKIAQIKGKEEICKHKKVISFFERYKEGEIIPDSNDVRRRYAEICMLTDNKEEEIELVKFIHKTLHILDEHGNELLSNPFEIKNI